MNYKDNNPNYNVNTRVKTFSDFCANLPGEKDKLLSQLRTFQPNSDRQNFTTNTRNEYDPMTHKITAITKDEVQDKIDSLVDYIDSKDKSKK